MRERVKVFAPASTSNLGPGYDLLGAALGGLGDLVEAIRRDDIEGVVIEDVQGDGGRLPKEADKNTAGIAATEALKLMGMEKAGVGLRLTKGLPLGSGMGSSGASAAAAIWAVNVLFGSPLTKTQLLPAGLQAESAVSGWHADNVGPSLLGGCVLIRSYDPLELVSLPVPSSLLFVMVTPAFELHTRQAREAVPQTISLSQHIANSGNLAALIFGLCQGDVPLFGRSVQDQIVEPARAPLIPGFSAVKQAALEAGAYGCSISGAGPTIFAVCDDREQAESAREAMQAAFVQAASLQSKAHICQVDAAGASVVES